MSPGRSVAAMAREANKTDWSGRWHSALSGKRRRGDEGGQVLRGEGEAVQLVWRGAAASERSRRTSLPRGRATRRRADAKRLSNRRALRCND